MEIRCIICNAEILDSEEDLDVLYVGLCQNCADDKFVEGRELGYLEGSMDVL